MGDPRGIGPEIIFKSLKEYRGESFETHICGDTVILSREAERQGFDLSKVSVSDPGGSASPGEASLKYIDEALSLKDKYPGSSLLTAPVEKRAVADYLPGFTGHTGYLAMRDGNLDTVMSFITKKMKMSLLTEHISLRNVGSSISIKGVIQHIKIVKEDLFKYFKIMSPKFVVASVNPHSGESVPENNEDDRVLYPAIEVLRSEGLIIDGPFSADHALRSALEGNYDFIISPYHDQLLPAFKVLLGPSVNMTFGLGYPRLSPDHGPALDIAGLAPADFSSMREALKLAVVLSYG